jgi:hypothetical protein
MVDIHRVQHERAIAGFLASDGTMDNDHGSEPVHLPLARFLAFHPTGRLFPRLIRIHARIDRIAGHGQSFTTVLNLLCARGNRAIQSVERRFGSRVSGSQSCLEFPLFFFKVSQCRQCNVSGDSARSVIVRMAVPMAMVMAMAVPVIM